MYKHYYVVECCGNTIITEKNSAACYTCGKVLESVQNDVVADRCTKCGTLNMFIRDARYCIYCKSLIRRRIY